MAGHSFEVLLKCIKTLLQEAGSSQLYLLLCKTSD